MMVRIENFKLAQEIPWIFNWLLVVNETSNYCNRKSIIADTNCSDCYVTFETYCYERQRRLDETRKYMNCVNNKSFVHFEVSLLYTSLWTSFSHLLVFSSTRMNEMLGFIIKIILWIIMIPLHIVYSTLSNRYFH